MENKSLRNFYYSIFFIGFFVSVDFGEKRNPRENGIYFITVLGMGLWFLFLNILSFASIAFNYNVLLFIGVGSIVAFNYWFFSEQNVGRVRPDFNHFGHDHYKKKRKLIAFFLFLFFFTTTIGSAIINNEDVRSYLIH